MPPKPIELMLTTAQLPPAFATRSWLRIISSGSACEMPKAYITFLPVFCSWSRMSGMIAFTRSASGE